MMCLCLIVVDLEQVLELELKLIGVCGVFKCGGNSVQVIIGFEVDIIVDEMCVVIGGGVIGVVVLVMVVVQLVMGVVVGLFDLELICWFVVFGGVINVVLFDVVVIMCLCVVVCDLLVVDCECFGMFDVVWVLFDMFYIVCGNVVVCYVE